MERHSCDWERSGLWTTALLLLLLVLVVLLLLLTGSMDRLPVLLLLVRVLLVPLVRPLGSARGEKKAGFKAPLSVQVLLTPVMLLVVVAWVVVGARGVWHTAHTGARVDVLRNVHAKQLQPADDFVG